MESITLEKIQHRALAAEMRHGNDNGNSSGNTTPTPSVCLGEQIGLQNGVLGCGITKSDDLVAQGLIGKLLTLPVIRLY